METDVYEIAFKAVKAASEAYRRKEPGNRQMLKFAAIEAMDCRISEAEQGDIRAIIDVISIARHILETTETAILDDRDPDKQQKLCAGLGLLMRNYPWVPVLMGPRGKTAGEQIVDSLGIGQGLNGDGKWSLTTPMNRLCFRVISITEHVLHYASLGKIPLSWACPGLPEPALERLIEIYGEKKRLKPLSKANAGLWANRVLIPTVLTLDPELESIPEARQILRSKRVKENGPKLGYLRSELIKYIGKALQKLLL
jgi:hypothetical protein